MKTKEAQRRYQREWKAQRRNDWLANKACVICGSTDRLEVDHIDRATKVTHNVWSWSEVRRNIELAKCQVLCYDHHLEKTRAENLTTEHGLTMYQKYGCRCGVCKKAKQAENARNR